MANHNIHTAGDTLDHIHYGLASEILKMNVACVARRLGARESVVLRQSSSPVVAWGANRLDAFVLGTDRALYHKWWDGANWGPAVDGYEYMGGVCMSAPQVVGWGPNRLDVFVTGTDSALYDKWWDGNAWGPAVDGYEYMGGVCVGDPRIISPGPEPPRRLPCLGTDRALYHKWWDGNAWGPAVDGYEYLGGVCVGQPEVIAWGVNRLDVFSSAPTAHCITNGGMAMRGAHRLMAMNASAVCACRLPRLWPGGRTGLMCSSLALMAHCIINGGMAMRGAHRSMASNIWARYVSGSPKW